MGTKITNIRPSADVSVEHALNGASTAWQCLAEETADDDSTYIYHSISSTTSSTKTSSVIMTGNIGVAKKLRVDKATLFVRAMQTADGTSAATVEYVVNETSGSGAVTVETSWTTTELDVDPSLFTDVGEYSIPLKMITTGAKGTSKSAQNFDIRITQAYLHVEYVLFNQLDVIQCGTGSISGQDPTGLVEIPYSRDLIVEPAATTRFVKAFSGETDITDQFKVTVEHHDITDADFTVTQRSSTTSNGWQKQDANMTYMSSMTGNSTLYGVTRWTLNLPQAITLNLSIVRPTRTGDYVYVGKLDTALNTTSQASTAQYAQRWAGSTTTTPVTYSMTIPAGQHFFEMQLYHSRNNSVRTSTVTFSSPGYDVTLPGVRYSLPETEDNTQLRIIFSDYAETYVKKNGVWTRAAKIYEKSNGVWVEKTPQTTSIIPQVFEKDFITEII